MGIEEIEPDAGIGHHHGQKLLANSQPATLLADVEMANTPGARLLAERIAIQTAHANQLAVEKRPQQLFTRRVKAVLTPRQLSSSLRSMLKFSAILSAFRAIYPGSSGVTGSINRRDIAFPRY